MAASSKSICSNSYHSVDLFEFRSCGHSYLKISYCWIYCWEYKLQFQVVWIAGLLRLVFSFFTELNVWVALSNISEHSNVCYGNVKTFLQRGHKAEKLRNYYCQKKPSSSWKVEVINNEKSCWALTFSEDSISLLPLEPIFQNTIPIAKYILLYILKSDKTDCWLLNFTNLFCTISYITSAHFTIAKLNRMVN